MEIKGDKINLRKLKETDSEHICQNAKDFEISEYTTVPHPYTLKMAKEFIKTTKKGIEDETGFEFGIELKENNEIVGMISLMNIDKNNKNAELGYRLGKKYWRQGITNEAMKLILKFGFKELKLKRIYAKVLHPNIASAKLLEKFNFTKEGIERKATFRHEKWFDDIVYSILNDEFILN